MLGSAPILDGRAVAAELTERIGRDVAALIAEGVTRGLAVVLVGEDPASQVYVRRKVAETRRVGMVLIDAA